MAASDEEVDALRSAVLASLPKDEEDEDVELLREAALKSLKKQVSPHQNNSLVKNGRLNSNYRSSRYVPSKKKSNLIVIQPMEDPKPKRPYLISADESSNSPSTFSRSKPTGKFSRFESSSDSDDESDLDLGSVKSAESWSEDEAVKQSEDTSKVFNLNKEETRADATDLHKIKDSKHSDDRKSRHRHSHRKSHKKHKSKERKKEHRSKKRTDQASEVKKPRHKERKASVDIGDRDSDCEESRFKHSTSRKIDVVVPRFSDIVKTSATSIDNILINPRIRDKYRHSDLEHQRYSPSSSQIRPEIVSSVVKVIKDSKNKSNDLSPKYPMSGLGIVKLEGIGTKRKIEIDDSQQRKSRPSVHERLGKVSRHRVEESLSSTKRKTNSESVNDSSLRTKGSSTLDRKLRRTYREEES